MLNIVGISFDNEKQIYYFNPNGLKLKKNLTVIVETERGLQFGKVEIPNFDIESEKIKFPLKDVIRISTKKDYAEYKKKYFRCKTSFK